MRDPFDVDPEAYLDIAPSIEDRGKPLFDLRSTVNDLQEQVERLTQEKKEAQAEVAACLEFLGTELGWEWFRIEQLYFKPDDAQRKSNSQDNARQLSNFLKDKRHGISFLQEHAVLQQQVSALRDALFNARKKATEIVDEYVMARGQSDPDVNVGHARLWGARRVRNEVSTIIDAALTQPPEPAGIKGPLAKMSPQLRNVLYDLIRKVPPLADPGDQQAMDEFIAEVMPSHESGIKGVECAVCGHTPWSAEHAETHLQPASPWISVKDRLPALDADNCCMDDADRGRFSEIQLVFDEDEAERMVAFYDNMHSAWFCARTEAELAGVTHWQPLPEPPSPEPAPEVKP